MRVKTEEKLIKKANEHGITPEYQNGEKSGIKIAFGLFKERIEGMIQIHEERIEEFVDLLESLEGNFEEINVVMNVIKSHYESIMILEGCMENFL